MSYVQPSILSIIYQQHAQFNAELTQMHHALNKLYKKLAKIERALSGREKKELSRTDRKKRLYSRTLAKSAIGNVERQQSEISQNIEQCSDLIASYSQEIYMMPMTPWTAQTHPPPFLFAPHRPVPYPSWAYSASQSSSDVPIETGLQDWDVTILQEQRRSSFHASSTDSGYFESVNASLGTTNDATDHAVQYACMAPMFDTSTAGHQTLRHEQEKMAQLSEKDGLHAIQTPVSVSPLAGLEAQSAGGQHRRGYSMGAAQVISGHLSTPVECRTMRRRSSVGPAADIRNDMFKIAECGQRIDV